MDYILCKIDINAHSFLVQSELSLLSNIAVGFHIFCDVPSLIVPFGSLFPYCWNQFLLARTIAMAIGM